MDTNFVLFTSWLIILMVASVTFIILSMVFYGAFAKTENNNRKTENNNRKFIHKLLSAMQVFKHLQFDSMIVLEVALFSVLFKISEYLSIPSVINVFSVFIIIAVIYLASLQFFYKLDKETAEIDPETFR